MENKSKKFTKDSEEAKEFMSNLQSKRGSNRGSKQKRTIETHSSSQKPDQETFLKKCKIKMLIFHKFLIIYIKISRFLKDFDFGFAKKKGVTYYKKTINDKFNL